MSDVITRSAIEQERDDLNQEREQIMAEMAEMNQHRSEKQQRLVEIGQRLRAHDAYMSTLQSVKAGKSTRAKAGQRDREITDLLRANPDGLGRGDIIERLGLKGDKAGETSVSNALTKMVKAVTIERGGDKKYRLPESLNQAA